MPSQLRIVGNVPLHLQNPDGMQRLQIHYASFNGSMGPNHLSAATIAGLLFSRQTLHAVVVFQDERTLLILCLLKRLLPFLRWRLYAIDYISLHPESRKAKVLARVKKWLLSKTALFVLHVKHSAGYQKYLGIGSDRIAYVPYIAKQWSKVLQTEDHSEQYILSCGRSRRDYRTFIQAVRDLPYPVKILLPAQGALAYHRSEMIDELSRLPPNVEILQDDGSYESWLRIMACCRLLVVPIVASSMYAEGVGTYLAGMALRKCVVITRSEAVNGILEDGAAVLVKPGDPNDMRLALIHAWENDAYRERIAATGYEYARGLGTESNLQERMFAAIRSDLIKNILARQAG